MAFPFWFRHLQGYQDSLLNLHTFRYTTSTVANAAEFGNPHTIGDVKQF